jgi:hypothetical protein
MFMANLLIGISYLFFTYFAKALFTQMYILSSVPTALSLLEVTRLENSFSRRDEQLHLKPFLKLFLLPGTLPFLLYVG